MNRFRWLIGAVALAAFTHSHAAPWPDKPVRYVIPVPPGGESDIAARFQQVKFRDKFKQDLIVESRAGAGGALA